MCVYGHSYGYSKVVTEKILIWDFTKSSMDGSNTHSVLDSFDEYDVTICFDDLNSDRTGNVILYGINGQNFANTVITNNIGPVTYAKANNGVINENYQLPSPVAYDVLEGNIDFEGTVIVRDPNGSKVTLYENSNIKSNDKYEEGLYFKPSMVGNYTISYIAKDSKGINGETLNLNVNISNGKEALFEHGLDRNTYLDKGSKFTIPSAKLNINGNKYDLLTGANIAGFEKVANAMLAQGI